MNPQETPIIVRLDLSHDKTISTLEIAARIPGRPHVQHVVLASECGAPQSEDGSPQAAEEWAACAHAMTRLAGEVNRIAAERRSAGETVRLWIGGNAGLPVFFHLGLALSGWAPPVTFVYRDKQGGMYNFALDRPASTGTYFGSPTQETKPAPSDDVALTVASAGAITPEQVSEYEKNWSPGFGEIVRLHAPDKLTEDTFAVACHELELATANLPSRSLTAFLRCPTPLALALGRLINRKRFATLSVPDYRPVPGGRSSSYRPALVLLPPGPRRQRPRATVLSVVHFSANSRSHSRLNLRGEADRIELGLREGKRRYRLERITKTDPDIFMETLRRTTPSIVHFSGHGGPDGIVMESDDHGHVVITPEMFATAIKHAGATVEVVVLNACHSNVLAEALLAHVDCVIGLSDKIDDDAALAFSSDFYRDLGSKGVHNAYEIARNQMAMKQMLDGEAITIAAAPGINLDEVMP
jgi:SMODS-associated and fused to various effectors sensor domain/CHAT domain